MDENEVERSVEHVGCTELLLVRRVDRAAPEVPGDLPPWAEGYLMRERTYRRAVARRYERSHSPWHLD